MNGKNSNYWTENDHKIGLCSLDQIGREVPENSEPQVKADPFEDDPIEDESEWSKPVWERELAAYHRNPARYRATNASNLNKLLDIEARAIERAAAAKTVQKPFDQMNMEELQRRLLIACGITDETGNIIEDKTITH